jgi:hypothetical protein
MAIDGEPKNGDYARYVENLVNRGNPSPGQVLARDTTTPPRPNTTTKAKAQPPFPAPQSGNTANISLAAQAAKRKVSIGVMIVALAVVWIAARMALAVVNAPEFQAEDLAPAVFLLFFAGMLFRGALGLRADARKSPAQLPPLSTVAGRKANTPDAH